MEHEVLPLLFLLLSPSTPLRECSQPLLSDYVVRVKGPIHASIMIALEDRIETMIANTGVAMC